MCVNIFVPRFRKFRHKTTIRMLLINYNALAESGTSEMMSTYEPNPDFGMTKLTDSQRELVEKFNCAFYEAQQPKSSPEELSDDLLLDTFDETYFTNIESYESAGAEEDETGGEGDHLLDYLISRSDEGFSELATPASDCTSTFDYDEFSENFEHFNRQIEERSPFFVPPPQFEPQVLTEVYPTEENEDIDIESLNIYFYNPAYEEETLRLPPVNTLVKNNMDFTSYIRNQEADSLTTRGQHLGDFGHLLGLNNLNNNISDSDYLEENASDTCESNQLILKQNESLLYDDPLLSSGSVTLPRRQRKYTTCSETSTDCEEQPLPVNLQCKWENCYQLYMTQGSLVKHIEKAHVEMKRGDEFTCFWINCPRKNKPFNARYKLLIHMRVHSGEKPNKCPFKGCNKAFSRLENLKIHQRSHTGERPYLCQFPNCTKSFSNSSDRAKHQRTHYDTKPYGCQVYGCAKKYTDPSSLRKHVKNHSVEEQIQLKARSSEARSRDEAAVLPLGGAKKSAVPRRSCPPGVHVSSKVMNVKDGFYANLDHSYSHNRTASSVRQDLKNRLSEKISKNALLYN